MTTTTTVDLKKVPDLALHPLCEIIPPCTDEEFKELKEDIKKNGFKYRSKSSRTKFSMVVVGTRLVLNLRRKGFRWNLGRSISPAMLAMLTLPLSTS